MVFMVKFLLLFRLLGVTGGGRRDESGVKELEDFVADVGELRLDPGQKAPLKWVAIRVKSGLRRRSRESGVKKRRRSGLRFGLRVDCDLGCTAKVESLVSKSVVEVGCDPVLLGCDPVLLGWDLGSIFVCFWRVWVLCVCDLGCDPPKWRVWFFRFVVIFCCDFAGVAGGFLVLVWFGWFFVVICFLWFCWVWVC